MVSEDSSAIGELLYELQMESEIDAVPLNLLSRAKHYDEKEIRSALEELRQEGLVTKKVNGYSVTEEFVLEM